MLSILRNKINKLNIVRTKLTIVNKNTFQTARQKANSNINSTNDSSGNLTFFVKTGLFTLTFTGVTFGIGTIVNYEKYNKNKSDLLNFNQPKRFELRSKINEWWNSLSTTEKYGISIIAVNTVVFMLWKIPRFFPFMSEYFIANPYSKIIYSPMLLSSFSHFSFWHYGLNMFFLYNFIGLINRIFDPQTFLAFYLSSGVFSSFFSYNIHRLLRRPGGGLGASGALLACFSICCLSFPKLKVSILGIVNCDSVTALKCLAGIDIIGLVLGWRYLGHAAHLGGYAFGFLYYYYWKEILVPFGKIVIREWKKMKSE